MTVLISATEHNPRNSEASLVVLSDGSWLLAWSSFSASATPPAGTERLEPYAREWAHSRDNNPAEIVAVRSFDRGRSWGSRMTLVGDDAGINVMQPSLLLLHDGRLAMSYSHRESPDAAQRFFTSSADGGQTWSPKVDMTNLGGYVTGAHDRMIRLRSGRLLQPCNRLDEGVASTVITVSDDEGLSWRPTWQIELPGVTPGYLSGIWEASVVERANGTLLLGARTARGVVYAAESDSSGDSWSAPVPLSVAAPSAPVLLRSLPDEAGPGERLLLFHNSTVEPGQPMLGRRTPLVVSTSEDGGQLWRMGNALEDDPERWFHYPACTVVDDVLVMTYSVTEPETRQWSLAVKTLQLSEVI